MRNYVDMPTVGYWPDLDGVEIKEVEYGGIYNYALVVAGTNTSTPTSHRVKVYCNNNYEGYIKIKGKRLNFSDCKWVFKTVYGK